MNQNTLTREQFEHALHAIQQQYLESDDSSDTANRFLDLIEILRNRPDEIWDWFPQLAGPSKARKEAETILRKCGTDLTFVQIGW